MTGSMSYKDLIAWKKAMDFVVYVYEAIKSLPDNEKYGLASQMKRAAVSIPSNIAEGHGRNLKKVFSNHLSIALGSLMELETQIELSQRFDYIPKEKAIALLATSKELAKIIYGLQDSIKPN